MAKTLYEKILEDHLVLESQGDTLIIYIDLHLVHEVTSPQAFAALRETKRSVRSPQSTFATVNHNVSTRTKDITKVETTSRIQMETCPKTVRNLALNYMISRMNPRGSCMSLALNKA